MTQIQVLNSSLDASQIWIHIQNQAEQIVSHTKYAVLIVQHNNAPIVLPKNILSVSMLKKIQTTQDLYTIDDLFSVISAYSSTANSPKLLINLATFTSEISVSNLPLFVAWIISINKNTVFFMTELQWDSISYLKEHLKLEIT